MTHPYIVALEKGRENPAFCYARKVGEGAEVQSLGIGGLNEEIIKAIVTATPTSIGIVIGFVLAGSQRWFERRRKLRCHWAAIRAEMALCKETAETFLSASIMSPLYRFSVTASKNFRME